MYLSSISPLHLVLLSQGKRVNINLILRLQNELHGCLVDPRKGEHRCMAFEVLYYALTGVCGFQIDFDAKLIVKFVEKVANSQKRI